MAKRWYIIHAYSNFENKVADSIREQVKHRGLDHLFGEIIVPTEKVVEVRHGQKHATERKFLPGYVLAKVELTDERQFQTPGVSPPTSHSLQPTLTTAREKPRQPKIRRNQ
jgi:transcription antitermination factor NusG